MAHASAKIGLAKYAVSIEAGGHRLVADEPVSNGGGATDPDPYELLLASVAACTAITLRMYADRKGWDVSTADIELEFSRESGEERIVRKLHLTGQLSKEQRTRLAAIAERCPVAQTLKRGVPILTELAPSAAHDPASGKRG